MNVKTVKVPDYKGIVQISEAGPFMIHVVEGEWIKHRVQLDERSGFHLCAFDIEKAVRNAYRVGYRQAQVDMQLAIGLPYPVNLLSQP